VRSGNRIIFVPIFRINSLAKKGIKIAVSLIGKKMIETGTLLQNRYLVEKQIGAGGMGAVYLAVDKRFDSHVAIKETFYKDEQLGDAFEREARLLNSLRHPVLPHVSDYFTEGDGYFLVMQFVEGEDLSDILKREGAFSVKDVLRWTDNLLEALDYLHSQEPPIIHRDIKPHNLKLTPRGDIILLDFGLAKLNAGETMGAISVFGYSRTYSPLEQIQGTGTDARSDIFALGATAYHLLTGKAPIEALARAAAIVAGKPDPLRPASEINDEIPINVANVLNSALALNPDARFVSAKAMRQAVEHALVMEAAENAEELPEPVLTAVVSPEEGVVNSAETENFPALEVFADKVRNLLEADKIGNFPVIPAEPVNEAVLPTPFAGKVKGLFETDVTENVVAVNAQPKKEETRGFDFHRATVEKAHVQPDKEKTVLSAPEILPHQTTVSEVATKVLPRKKASRLPLAAVVAGAIIFVGLAAGYFINKANSSNESGQTSVTQSIQETNSDTEQSATVSDAPTPQVSDSPLFEDVEQSETKPVLIEKTTVKRQTVQRQKIKDEPPAPFDTVEKPMPEPMPAETVSRPAAKQMPRRSEPQRRSQPSPRVIESQPAADIESIFTGRPAREDDEKLRRQEERRRQREEMSDEELREMRRQRRQERKQRQNKPPFPF
jgi:serine/threonine protein kinase